MAVNNKKDKIVLVNPLNSRNIGAVCRAMKCMGLHYLTIVGGVPVDHESARVLAVHASDILEKAVICDSLDEAVANSVLVAGITRRRGKKRKYFSLLPEELAERISLIKTGEITLLFGNEEAGLTDRELALCNIAVRIPTSPIFPSLNLSHAVQIIAYHVFRQSGSTPAPRYTPVNRQKLDKLVDVILESLQNIGFFSQVAPEDMGIFFRDILARSCLSGREAKRMETVFRKISGLGAGKGIPP